MKAKLRARRCEQRHVVASDYVVIADTVAQILSRSFRAFCAKS